MDSYKHFVEGQNQKNLQKKLVIAPFTVTITSFFF